MFEAVVLLSQISKDIHGFVGIDWVAALENIVT